MTKSLKDLLELYTPRAKGEKRFADKHIVAKHKDRNGNGDDVFNATKIKTVDRSPEHGYNAGEDEKVYESYDDGWYTHHQMYGKVSKENWKKGWRYNHLKEKPFYHLKTKTWHSKINESTSKLHHYDLAETEQIDEISIDLKQRYLKKGDNWLDNKLSYYSTSPALSKKIERRSKSLNKAEKDVLKAGHKPQGHLSGSPQLHAEDTDLQELSKKTLASYINKAAVKNLAHAGSLATQAHDADENKRKDAEVSAKKLVNKLNGIHRATKRLTKD